MGKKTKTCPPGHLGQFIKLELKMRTDVTRTKSDFADRTTRRVFTFLSAACTSHKYTDRDYWLGVKSHAYYKATVDKRLQPLCCPRVCHFDILSIMLTITSSSKQDFKIGKLTSW